MISEDAKNCSIYPYLENVSDDDWIPITKVVEDTAIEENDDVLRRALLLIREKERMVVVKEPEVENSREKPDRMIVISSTGGAAQHQGGALGQFEYDEDRRYYRQTSTDQGHKNFQAVYCYPDKDDEWWVSSTPGKKGGWLRNPRPSKSLPTSGWQYYDGKSWHDDPTLTISPGPLPPLARQFTVTATGAAAEWPSYLGVFTRTQRWWLGRPVYTNTQGQLLHHGLGDAGWMIGNALGYAALTGSRAHHSPVSEDSWRYYTGSEWKPASVTVTGSD